MNVKKLKIIALGIIILLVALVTISMIINPSR